jgi:hypothetical protein
MLVMVLVIKYLDIKILARAAAAEGVARQEMP